MKWLAVAVILAYSISVALPRTSVTIIGKGKSVRVPIVRLGKHEYLSLRMLGKAMGKFFPPDECRSSIAHIRWSAPGFFVEVRRNAQSTVYQSTIPAIICEGMTYVPLHDCMRLLDSAGVLVWHPTHTVAHFPRLHVQVPIQHRDEMRPLRYSLPPLLKRPTIELLEKRDPQGSLFITKASGFLASCKDMVIEETVAHVVRVVPSFRGDTTEIRFVCNQEVAPEQIAVHQDDKIITMHFRSIQIEPRAVATLRRVRLARYHISTDANGSRLKLVLTRSDRRAELHFHTARQPCLRIVRDAGTTRWLLDCVVLDAGHGGNDVGTIGVRGSREKDITLAVCKRLAAALRTKMRGVRVVMTRQGDEFVELHRRTEIANRVGGKLFLSLHCNAAPSKPHPANGVEVYVLSPARSAQAAEVAARENASIKLERNNSQYRLGELDQFILASVAQQGYGELSHLFAQTIDSILCSRLKLSSRGVHSAGFIVLIGASMPAVLIEMGFLSNPREERLLASPRWQHQIAQALAEAIVVYAKRYDHVLSSQESK